MAVKSDNGWYKSRLLRVIDQLVQELVDESRAGRRGEIAVG